MVSAFLETELKSREGEFDARVAGYRGRVRLQQSTGDAVEDAEIVEALVHNQIVVKKSEGCWVLC